MRIIKFLIAVFFFRFDKVIRADNISVSFTIS